MDRLISMSVFVRVADLGSFAAAAAALDLSGPMVGKHVAALEVHLGLRLINRTTRRQSLTDFGKIYFERCRAILAQAEAADALAAEYSSEPKGRLRVTMPALFGRKCVLPLLLDLTERHKGLELELSFGDTISDLLTEGYDLAIRTGHLSEGSGVIARRIARQRMIVCASPDLLERLGRPASIQALADYPCIVYSRTARTPPWLFPGPDGTVLDHIPQGRLRMDDMDAIASAAVSGMGVGWLPSWLVRDQLSSGLLVPVFPDHAPYLYDCHAAWLPTPHVPMKVRVAVDALAANLPALMS
jgi:DNA-binding transcriptional LysR family regulator